MNSIFEPARVRGGKALLILLAVGCWAFPAQGASFMNVTNGVWSTGFSSGGTQLSQTTSNVDPHYTLIQTPAGCSGLQCTNDANQPFGPNTYVVLNPGGQFPFTGAWLPNDGNSLWLGPRSNQTNPNSAGTTFPDVDVFASATDAYVYRLVFNLGALNLDPATALIQLGWISDNANNGTNPLLESHIRLCAITSATDPVCSGGIVPSSTNSGQSALGLTQVTIQHNGSSVVFGSGLMALDFFVYNAPIPYGLNPSGVRVEVINATADPLNGGGAVPEPATWFLMSAGFLVVGLFRRRL